MTINEKNLQKVDHLLALIPVIIFIFPVTFFILVLLDLLDFDTVIIPLVAIFIVLLYLFAWGTWSWKLTFKHQSKLKSGFFGFYLALLDFSSLVFIIWQLTVLESLIGTNQVVWEILMGFISIVMITVLADFHKLPDVYRNRMEWIQNKIY